MDDIFDNLLLTLALGGLAVSGLLFASALLYPYLRKAWGKATALARAAFCGACVVACLFGGAKHKIGGITYPKTDTDVAYLTDAGSYVTNDAVHVAFTRVIVPDSATFYLDYCALDATNSAGVATNWVNAKTATFADLSVPFDFAFANATNFNWVAYTDWTPGPAVQTNGVWHAYWGVDKKEGRYFIPVRTCVRADGEVIATPKSKWDAQMSTPDGYITDGLVAMYDGEWNAGRGKHDPNATVWVDLTGNGNDLAMPDATIARWQDNRAEFGYDGATGGFATAPIPDSIANAENLTVEAVLSRSKRNDYVASRNAVSMGLAINFRGYLGYKNGMLLSVVIDGINYYPLTFPLGDGTEAHATNYPNTASASAYMASSDKDTFMDSVKYYNNGELYTGSWNRWGGETVAPLTTINVGSGGPNFDGMITAWNVRVYNRQLTAEEIAHNAAVDQKRFRDPLATE